ALKDLESLCIDQLQRQVLGELGQTFGLTPGNPKALRTAQGSGNAETQAIHGLAENRGLGFAFSNEGFLDMTAKGTAHREQVQALEYSGLATAIVSEEQVEART